MVKKKRNIMTKKNLRMIKSKPGSAKPTISHRETEEETVTGHKVQDSGDRRQAAGDRLVLSVKLQTEATITRQ